MLFYWPLTSRARKGYELTGALMPLPAGAKFVWVAQLFSFGRFFYAGVMISVGDPFSIVYGVPTALKSRLDSTVRHHHADTDYVFAVV